MAFQWKSFSHGLLLKGCQISKVCNFNYSPVESPSSRDSHGFCSGTASNGYLGPLVGFHVWGPSFRLLGIWGVCIEFSLISVFKKTKLSCESLRIYYLTPFGRSRRGWPAEV